MIESKRFYPIICRGFIEFKNQILLESLVLPTLYGEIFLALVHSITFLHKKTKPSTRMYFILLDGLVLTTTSRSILTLSIPLVSLYTAGSAFSSIAGPKNSKRILFSAIPSSLSIGIIFFKNGTGPHT